MDLTPIYNERNENTVNTCNKLRKQHIIVLDSLKTSDHCQNIRKIWNKRNHDRKATVDKDRKEENKLKAKKY